jgi:hypothetical protein
LGARFGLRVNRCEPLLKLCFGPTSIAILRCVDISLSSHSVIADKLRRAEPPLGATVLGGLLAGPAVNRVLVELPAWALDRKRNLLEARNGELCDPQEPSTLSI